MESFPWDELPGSSTYLKRIKKRIIRENQSKAFGADADMAEREGDHLDVQDTGDSTEEIDNLMTRQAVFKSWKHDPGERSRRIMQWWIKMCAVHNDKLACFWQAIRVIVLNQASSASIERVFL